MTIPVEQFNRGMHEHQLDLFAAFDQKVKRGVRIPQFFIEEWHRRARKTTGALNLGVKECCRLPKAKFGHIMPTQVMARNIVWDDPNMLRNYLPDKREMDWKLNEQKMLVTFENGSQYKIGGADDPNTWRGVDFIGVNIDEWSLIKENLWTEILRPIIAADIPPHLKGYNVFRWVNFMYTPQPCGAHAYMMFDDACCLLEGGILPTCGVAPKLKTNWYASRVDGEISGIIPQAQLRQMQKEVEEGKIPQAFYDQEIKCARVTAEEMTLITSLLLHELNLYHANTTTVVQEVRKIVSIDPAWGGDVCKIMGMVNYTVKEDKSILDRYADADIALAAKVVAQKIGTKNFIVDCVNDVEIANILARDEAGYNVIRFKSSYKPQEDKDTPQNIRFANLRAQAYYNAMLKIRTKQAGAIKSPALLRQLPIASRYTTQAGSGRMIIIPKDKMRKKDMLGHSPDDADCYVMGCYGMDKVTPNEESQAKRAARLIPSHIRRR